MNHTPLVPTGATTDYLISSLVSLDPPLPVYLFHMVAGLRDKSAKGYPLKKVRTPLFCLRSFLSLRFFCHQVLLLLWKTILACCGGSRDLIRAKKLARELAGLPDEKEECELQLSLSLVKFLID